MIAAIEYLHPIFILTRLVLPIVYTQLVTAQDCIRVDELSYQLYLSSGFRGPLKFVACVQLGFGSHSKRSFACHRGHVQWVLE